MRLESLRLSVVGCWEEPKLLGGGSGKEHASEGDEQAHAEALKRLSI